MVEEILQIITLYQVEIIIGLSITVILLLILNIIGQIRISRGHRRYNQLVRGMDGINIEELLIQTEGDLRKINQDINTIEQNVSSINTRLTFALQKIGIVRYNAFGDMGSQLSFSLALMDDFLNGVVLTSIYGRDYATIYAKPLRDGKSTYPLSVEEIQAIDRAIRGESVDKSF